MAPSRFDNGTIGTNYSSIHSADAFVGNYQVQLLLDPLQRPELTIPAGYVHPRLNISSLRTRSEEVDSFQQSRFLQISKPQPIFYPSNEHSQHFADSRRPRITPERANSLFNPCG